MNEKISDLFSGGVEHRKNGCKRESGSMMEQRYVKPTATHVAAELLDKKPGVRVPILTQEEAQNHKVMLNEKEVLHSASAVLVWAAHAGYCLFTAGAGGAFAS